MAKDVVLTRFNQGGISDSKYQGESYSVAHMQGIDIHSLPGVIQANYKMKKDSGSAITELCNHIVVSSDGNVYFFSSESGKIWKKDSGGTYSLVYTTVPTAGEAKILGASEFENYIYWAVENKIFRVAINSADWGTLQDAWIADTAYVTNDIVVSHGLNYVALSNHTSAAATEPGVGADWATYWVLSTDGYATEYATFSVTDDTYHPMKAFNNSLWIGDGYKVANISGGIFTASALDIPSIQRIKTLDSIDIQLAIGTIVNNNVNKSTIYRWDTWSPSWNMDDTVEEIGINAFIPVDNYFFVQAGNVGNIYSYDNNMLYLTKRIPGDFTSTKNSVVNPNSVAFFKGKPLFAVSAFSASADSGATPGIYSYATVNPRLYNRVLALEYMTSTSSLRTIYGGMGVKGNDLYVAWKDGSTCGIDIIDYSNRYSGAYLDSRVIFFSRDTSNVYTDFTIGYVSMPTGCSVKAYTKINYASSWTEMTLTQDTINNRYYSDLNLDCNTLELRIELVCSTSSTPIIDYISLTADKNYDNE